MSKKVFIGVGHGGIDPGATGYIVEKDANLTMAKACRDYLVKAGVEVKMSRTNDENDDISEEIRECNAFDPDLAIDVHNNSGGGDGFEVLCSINGGKGKELAKNIETEVKKIGQNSRGIKTRKNSAGTDYFGFIRCTKCPAVICEGVFVDNKTDVKIADTKKEQEAFGVAYAKGILKTLGVTDVKSYEKNEKNEKVTSKGYKVKVTADALHVRKGPGKKYGAVDTVKKGEVFTIVLTENSNWGKLKSGAGWINLKYTERV